MPTSPKSSRFSFVHRLLNTQALFPKKTSNSTSNSVKSQESTTSTDSSGSLELPSLLDTSNNIGSSTEISNNSNLELSVSIPCTILNLKSKAKSQRSATLLITDDILLIRPKKKLSTSKKVIFVI